MMMTSMLLMLLLACSCLSPFAMAGDKPVLSTQTMWDASVQANAPQEWNFNSGSEQVWYGDSLVYENYLGKKSIEYNADFTYDTQFRICSNSKLFVAVSIMQLVERGVIKSIYDPITNYLNTTDYEAWGLPKGTKKWCPIVYQDTTKTCQNVTFVSLMSMSSGIVAAITCTYNPTQWQYQYCLSPTNSTLYPGSIATTISYFIQNPLQWVPGPGYTYTTSTYQYANENFVILSYIVQRLSGLSFQDYLQKNIFTPVGMKNTVYDPWSQAFQLLPQLASEYYYYTNYANGNDNDKAFQYGSCASTEYDPGYQAGSGGMISTLPDMVKWYTTLFITKNASLLNAESMRLLLFPWAVEAFNPPQYYGLGVEMLYQDPYLAMPPLDAYIPPPISIYYMGGSMCTFFTIVIYNTTYNYFTGTPLQTLPIVSAVARNNRILNITQATVNAVPSLLQGSWFTITGFPTGWGSSNGDYTDTFYEALNLAMYFAAYVYVPAPQPTPSPTSVPNTNSVDDDKIGSMQAPGFVAVMTIIPLCAVIALIIAYFMYFWVPKSSVSQQRNGIEVVENPLKSTA